MQVLYVILPPRGKYNLLVLIRDTLLFIVKINPLFFDNKGPVFYLCENGPYIFTDNPKKK